ncbi:hypothetical protein FH972_015259 [Carpinus fangiana]|uniref:Uncharacterized protein n=1 Tax=Carpinus fangiana TaxID=176857 RepID=A0A5N6RCI6_9ROSI|nr:hypothetical protein FH972_015259 [Carpinus fangiana]
MPNAAGIREFNYHPDGLLRDAEFTFAKAFVEAAPDEATLTEAAPTETTPVEATLVEAPSIVVDPKGNDV